MFGYRVQKVHAGIPGKNYIETGFIFHPDDPKRASIIVVKVRPPNLYLEFLTDVLSILMGNNKYFLVVGITYNHMSWHVSTILVNIVEF